MGWITLDGFTHMSWAQAGLATAELSWPAGMAESLVFFPEVSWPLPLHRAPAPPSSLSTLSPDHSQTSYASVDKSPKRQQQKLLGPLEAQIWK